MNELIPKKSWWKRNWKWLTPLIGLFLVSVLILSSGMSRSMSDIAKAYASPSLYENALKKAQKNEQVTQLLGTLEAIDNLAIAEGYVEYSNNYNSIETSIRIKGSKNGKGRMDISAAKENDVWVYKKIQVRLKKSKVKINIL